MSDKSYSIKVTMNRKKIFIVVAVLLFCSMHIMEAQYDEQVEPCHNIEQTPYRPWGQDPVWQMIYMYFLTAVGAKIGKGIVSSCCKMMGYDVSKDFSVHYWSGFAGAVALHFTDFYLRNDICPFSRLFFLTWGHERLYGHVKNQNYLSATTNQESHCSIKNDGIEK